MVFRCDIAYGQGRMGVELGVGHKYSQLLQGLTETLRTIPGELHLNTLLTKYLGKCAYSQDNLV